MRAMSKQPKPGSKTIARNKRDSRDFELGEKFEAGMALQGWEVKSLRLGKAQLTDTYVVMKGGEALLIGLAISPLDTASTHPFIDPTRTRKLLLHKKELAKILAATQQKGLTCVCTSLYWKGHLVKARLALATGKQPHDKRETVKQRDWDRQKQRLLRDSVKQPAGS